MCLFFLGCCYICILCYTCMSVLRPSPKSQVSWWNTFKLLYYICTYVHKCVLLLNPHINPHIYRYTFTPRPSYVCSGKMTTPSRTIIVSSKVVVKTPPKKLQLWCARRHFDMYTRGNKSMICFTPDLGSSCKNSSPSCHCRVDYL